MDPAVGVRDMDIAHAGFGLDGIQNPPTNAVGLEGALLAPTSVRRGLAAASDFVPKIQQLLNAPAALRDQGASDPLVTPPIYGAWHAHVERVNAPGADATWVNQLNLDPRYRAAAGLGARVVRAHEEEYLRSAWAQIGDVLTLNRRIRRAQLAIKASSAVFAKSLHPLPAERAVALLSPTLPKIRGGAVTLAAAVRASVTPRAALSAALVKQLRPRGRVARALFPVDSRPAVVGGTVARLAQGTLSAAPSAPAPGGPTIESINQAVLNPVASPARHERAAPAPTPAQIREVVQLLSAPALIASAVARVERTTSPCRPAHGS
jgi:hypothetical protein